jgi:acyl-CoA hydrolase
MPGGAEVAPDFYDIVCTDPAASHALFGPPNAKVSTADYAIGLHASSLVADGGTLQIGIGSLGDAIAQALIVRDRHGDEYRSILAGLCPDGLVGRELGRFDQGLYGCSEMFVNGFLKLMEAGILHREVFPDTVLQQCLNDGRITSAAVTPQTLTALLAAGCIQSPLSRPDLDLLTRLGVFKPGHSIDGEWLVCDDGSRWANDLHAPDNLSAICQQCLGARLLGGVVMTGGFFLGPNDFYQRLRSMPAQDLARIDMTRIAFINQLDGSGSGNSVGQGDLKRAQRSKARFMNTTMVVTLLGAAASDALESGEVVSGVGGQYNFVAMAHALPQARSILMLRATHDNAAGLSSSIVWSHSHTTIPRHLRDVVVTEYGVAELRGQGDSEVVKRLIAIADSRFQSELVQQAQAHGKLEAGWVLPARYAHNLPAALDAKLHPWSQAGLLPAFPFGTDLTPDEQHIVMALKRLKHASHHPVELVRLAVKSLWLDKPAPQAYLERLGLDDAHSFKDLFLRKLFAGNL